jgi:tryptophanyl-tRNA synthetase
MLLTEIPKLAGTDGRKMSKSYGNAVYLKDSAEVIRKKIFPMVTDTRRKRRTDPGEPDDCPVFTLHVAFVDKETRDGLAAGCRSATVGCLECKKVIIDSLVRLLTPYWEKRGAFEANPGRVWEILEEGNTKARRAARKTMEDVRSAIGF